jgi:hypothetical protein
MALEKADTYRRERRRRSFMANRNPSTAVRMD